jgi:hypothetical protein
MVGAAVGALHPTSAKTINKNSKYLNVFTLSSCQRFSSHELFCTDPGTFGIAKIIMICMLHGKGCRLVMGFVYIQPTLLPGTLSHRKAQKSQ